MLVMTADDEDAVRDIENAFDSDYLAQSVCFKCNLLTQPYLEDSSALLASLDGPIVVMRIYEENPESSRLVQEFQEIRYCCLFGPKSFW